MNRLSYYELTSFYKLTSFCLWTDLFLPMNWPLSVYELTSFYKLTLFLSMNWPLSSYELTSFCLWTDLFLSMNWLLSVNELTIFLSINWPNQHSVCVLPSCSCSWPGQKMCGWSTRWQTWLPGKTETKHIKQTMKHAYIHIYIYILFSVMCILIRPSDIFNSAAHSRHRNTWEQIMCPWKQQWYIINNVNCCWYHKNTWEQNMYR